MGRVIQTPPRWVVGLGESQRTMAAVPSHIIGANPYNSGGSSYKGGSLTGSGLVAGEAPGGGSYGGKGGRSELNGGTDSLGAHPISGQTYGTINVDALLAGSGGGAGSMLLEARGVVPSKLLRVES